MSTGELPDILDALATIEDAITSIKRVFTEPPDSVAAVDLPACIHELPIGGTCERLSAGKSRFQIVHTIPVLILGALLTAGLRRAVETTEALLDDYLDALIDNDSISGQVLETRVASWEINPVEYGGVQYMAIQAKVEATLVKTASA